MKKAFAIVLLAAITLSACTPDETSTQAETVLPETAPVSGILIETEKAVEPSLINNPIQEEVNQPTDSAEKDIDTVPVLSTSISSPTTSVEETPTESKPTEPSKPQTEETIPDETQSAETQPTPTEPEVTEPPVPEVTEPTPTDPEPTGSPPTDPEPTDPAPTEPEVEQIDIAALESYGRSYASSAYGYKGTSACGPGSGAGYFPGATKQILTMADGYSLVCQAIDAQYYRDAACGYSPYEEIDGVTVRCPINIRVEATGEPNMYVIWVYYGGSA